MTTVFLRLRDPGEPTDAQKEAGNYAKRKVAWNGLSISVENEAGSMRRGTAPDGTEWATRLMYAYGYVNGSMGVDGDQVDVYLGPDMDWADTVYVVHQRRWGDWSAYDEDKAMLGFMTETEAREAFLSCYDDSRFLGPVTAMPVAEFVERVLATKERPAMIKAFLVRAETVEFFETHPSDRPILLLKSYVGPHLRGGTMVAGYENGRTAHQADLFADAPVQHKPKAPRPEPVAGVAAAKDDLDWSSPAPHPKALVMRDRAGGGTTLAHRDASGSMHGIRDVSQGGGHDASVAAWRAQAERAGHAVEDHRASPPTLSKKFYATAVRGPVDRKGNVGYLAGPFDTHDEAKAHVDRARAKAVELDPMAHFHSYGTASREASHHPPGVLNGHLGIAT